MNQSMGLRSILVAAFVIVVPFLFGARSYGQEAAKQQMPEPGLLFYLSGAHGFNADISAGGTPEPNFLRDVKIIPDGAKGAGFECGDKQLMSYWAPGNIYAERGTLSFFWRSRTPVGRTEFPVFRVGYADHSSWDMVWLRIDYNGHGFDAFVTDANLARIRVSSTLSPFPKPDRWIHLALAWDETIGIRFYIDGKVIAQRDSVAVLYAGLDQFGPHSRVISPAQVQSAYNFVRAGDIDEIHIYDRMLSGANIANLARGEAAGAIPDLRRTLSEPRWRAEWYLRYGWNRQGDIPPSLNYASTRVRKVEIHNAYDLKRWWWKGTDGIRETTWPGVYNRSRLPGRNDYFQLPDWDCYSLSGKSVTFFLPDETWNHLEISGAASGSMVLVPGDGTENGAGQVLFHRPEGQEKTFHQLSQPVRGGQLRFTNDEQEVPIGELSAYNVDGGKEPAGICSLSYTLQNVSSIAADQLGPLRKFIHDRFLPDERMAMIAVSGDLRMSAEKQRRGDALPLVHILIPCDGVPGGRIANIDSTYSWEKIDGGLDGIAIDLPAMYVRPTHGEYLPLNIRIKDPIWPMRDMLDFSFSVRPGEARTLWLDTRDRIMANGKSLYLTIAAAAPEFGAELLEGARIRLIFKPWKVAYREHVADRFTQVRDNYANLVEEHPATPRLNLYNRFAADMTDLLRVDPKHYPGQNYWYDDDRAHPKPQFVQPRCPEGIPLWAFRQIEDLRYFKRFVLWWIDNRQIGNGELGGGLSDDDDLTNCWPGAALMGCDPKKIGDAVVRLLDAIYREGMFTNGLSTIQTDGLHAHEEGIEAQAQAMLVDYGSPKQIERMMETVRALDERLMVKNKRGHRHLRSSYFSGTRIADEGVWEWSLQPQEYLLLQPVLTLAEYNGNPRARRLAIDMADGLLAHARKDVNGKLILDSEINFSSDSSRPSPLGAKGVFASSGGDGATLSTSSAGIQLFWAVYRMTGDRKYLQPLLDLGEGVLSVICADALDILNLRESWGKRIVGGITPAKGSDLFRHIAWQMTGNKEFLENYYADQIESSALREYINTEGSLWTDRVVAANRELQRSRLGGIALVRGAIHTGHVVSWKFKAPATEESLAILVPEATPSSIKIVAYALDQKPVEAMMTAWSVEPGMWEIVQGIDTNGDENTDTVVSRQVVSLERSKGLLLTFSPRQTTVLTLRLQSMSVPYSQRPDLGIGRDDVVLKGNAVQVKVHSLGSQPAPASTVALLEGSTVIASASVPGIQAPVDLSPKYAEVTLPMPAGVKLRECSVVLDPDGKLNEVTRMNNRVDLSEINVTTGNTPDVGSGDQVLFLGNAPRPEHICLNVKDPSVVAKWYTDHLGMKIMRRSAPPSRTLFIGDSAGNMTLELTGNTNAPTIDFSSVNHQSMHLAFMVDDVNAMRDSLTSGGATLVVDVTATPAGDQVLMLRDPWGLPIQFVKRVEPMLRQTGLRFEHLALNVPDPLGLTNWYLENLGMKVLRQGGPPGHTSFVADGGSNMMFEIGANTAAPFLDASKWSNLAFHFAFVVDDVRAIRTGLIEAGATLVEDIRQTSAGDEVLVLRDPWGFPIQFIKRGEPLLK